MEKLNFIMVLSDGDTYTGLDGCTIRMVRPDEQDALDAGSDPKHLIEEGKLPIVTQFGSKP